MAAVMAAAQGTPTYTVDFEVDAFVHSHAASRDQGSCAAPASLPRARQQDAAP